MKLREAFVAVAIGVALAASAAPPAEASTGGDLSKLAKLVPGVNKTKLEATMRYLAKKRKTTYAKQLTATVSAINKQISRNKDKRAKAMKKSLSMPGLSGLNTKRYAKTARAAGDIFVSTAGLNSSGIGYGHTGIYYRTNQIMHAPGASNKATTASLREVEVGIGTEYMAVKGASAKTKQDVANYAVKTYKGQGYNYMFLTNKFPDDVGVSAPLPRITPPAITVLMNRSNEVSCSELVWASYQKKAKIDLDGYTSGIGDWLAVFPWDIALSSKTTTYATSY